MQKVIPFLWYNNNAEEALDLYTNLFPNSKVTMKRYQPSEEPGGKERLFTATFEINGSEFHVLNGGPMFKFTEAISLFVLCESQEEVDRYWDGLTKDGGQESHCGWLKDKFGLSWQIIPTRLNELLTDPDKAKADRAMQAMLQMGKLNISELEKAAEG